MSSNVILYFGNGNLFADWKDSYQSINFILWAGMKWFDLWSSRSWLGHIFCNVHIKMTTKIKPYGKDFIFIMFIKYCPYDNCTDLNCCYYRLHICILFNHFTLASIIWFTVFWIISSFQVGQKSKNAVFDPELKRATRRDLLIMCCCLCDCDWPGPDRWHWQ